MARKRSSFSGKYLTIGTKYASQAESGPPPDTISITNNYIVFNATSDIITGNDTTTVTSSGAWTSSITYNEDTGWITYDPTSGNSGQLVTIACDPNDFGSGRTADITFTCGTASVNFDITQTPPA